MLKDSIQSIKAAYSTPEIRQRVYFIVIILVIFRLLAAVPVVGIDRESLSQLFGQLGGIGDTISTVSGGVLETASIVAIGLGPYINASIILQLLGTVIPKLEELRKEGSQGRRIISMYTRYLTVPFAILQSFVIYSTLRGFGLVGELQTLELITMVSALTGGALLMMWMGELVTDKGIGQGSSYLIAIGILASLPSIVSNNIRTADTLQMIWFVFILLAIFAITIFLTQGERRIKVMYSRRVRATGVQDNYVPIKLTQFGVMPVIFAVSLISFPQLIAQFLVSRDFNTKLTEISSDIIRYLSNPLTVDIATFLLVIAFSFFYVTVVFNADELAENLQKQGAFIPGIRPGKQTASFLRKSSFRLTAVGGVFLATLAILPNVLVQTGILSATIMSGTGLLIIIGTVLEIKRQIESMIVVRSYDRYL
ncbi:preprotein translocase subunit SecY [Candidatus Nomurabacteria bacterium]|uniref:Protein translocase subunit SecY n=1 Tax=Candidatus Dojkabacteria bacterium TaxID=2099670 RepID=A0A955KX16_9BACT|nr:preprotein translocase subunit SecY [Candidatus Dojkabacteria bacterium]MCB9789403.1 preprotein translocase subunit SecY [Candidatus Nomurabacteria bacterium]MCB9803725.1 preprotein translocase subunit SecY [Candidatus Nomurabacteria bacterium]